MSLKVKYIDVPEGAQEAAQVECLGQPFSDPSSIASGAEDVAYATLEPGGWPLDGSRSIIPDEPQGFWWSATVSNDKGIFTEPPMITFTLPSAYTATGLSFFFWPSTDEWCSEIRVTWYNGTTMLHQTLARPDSAKWTLQKTVESFDKVCVELLRTNQPGRFAKVQRIEIGQTYWFDQEEITGVKVLNEIDPSLSELSVDTMQIEIHDRKGRDLTPQKNQRMELYRNEKLQAVQYITDSSRTSQCNFNFSCQSAIGLLGDDYLGGIFTDVPIKTMLEDVLDGFAFLLDESLADVIITGYLPICTRREALQQVLFAMGAVASTHGTDAIRIIPLQTGLSTPFTKGDIFQGAKVETSPRIAKVEVMSHKYTPSAEEETLLNAEEITGSDVLVTFADPHHSYNISGGTLTGSGANWVTITAQGNVTLYGKKYLHSTTKYTKRNLEATVSERNNVYAVEEATLVNRGNVDSVIKRLYSISQLRQTLSQEVVVSDQLAGQMVVSENAWGGLLRGYIKSMESTLTPSGHIASATILGEEVVFDGFRYSGELYSGDMGEVL